MFLHKFSSKNLIKLKTFFIASKFSFARRIPNPNSKDTSLFNKFSIETEHKQKQENHFSKKFKKEYGDNSLEISEDEKKLMRQYEKELASGKKIKNPIDEIMENEDLNRMIKESENSPSGSDETKNQFFSLLKEELEKIKNLTQNKEDNSEKSSNTSDLYSNEDLDLLFRNKKNRGMNPKEKINHKNLKLEDINSSELKEEEMGKEINDQYKKLSESENESREKDFYSLFDKSKLNKNKNKSKSNNQTQLTSEEKEFFDNEPVDVTKLRNLRKIKNITNREYTEHSDYESSIQAMNSEVEVVDSIPDMNILDKRSRNAEDEARFKDLIKSDIRPWEKSLEKKEGILYDAKKLSKITTINNISLKNQRNEIFKRRALELAKLWQMPAPETKHWYYKLRREEKEIIKVINMRKKLEQKRKLKQIRKQWTIDNKEIFDINYADFLNKDNNVANASKEMNESVKIPKHFKNVNEFLFFGEDQEFLRHYKRTCRNIENALNEFFLKNKQSIVTGIGRNADITITEVKMNKACTVVYAWWDLPYVTEEIMKTKSDENEAIYKSVEFKLNQACPYIKSHVTRKIGLKYAPDIKFVRDSFDEEINSFDEHLKEIRNEKNELQLFAKKDVHGDNFMKIIATEEFEKEIRKQIEETKFESTKTFLKNFFLDDKINIVNKFLAIKNNQPDLFQKIMVDVKKTIDLSKFENLYDEKDKKEKTMNREEKRGQVRRQKALKKMHLTEEDLKNDTKVDYTNSLYNFVHNYERKIPGQFVLGTSFKEMTRKAEKSQFLSEEADKNYKNQIKKAVRDSETIGKPKKTKKEKTTEFWKNLEKGVI